MATGILDEFDKMISITSNITLEDAISNIDKMEKYIPVFFSRNSYGDRISQLYKFEQKNTSVLVNIPICDCDRAISQYRDYSEGMHEMIEATSGFNVDPYDMGMVYDRDVLFINECFSDPECVKSANVGQALNQFETLIRIIPELKKTKGILLSYRNQKCNPKFVKIYCHSVCNFYKRLIAEILKTFISLDFAERNPRKYYGNSKPNTSTDSTNTSGRKAR